MEFPANPDAWMDVADHGLVVIGAIALAVIPGWLQAYRNHKEIRRVGRQTNEDLTAIKSQVVNGHAANPDAPNLRDDLDEIREQMRRWEPVLHIVDDLVQNVANLSRQLSDVAERLMAESDKRRLQIGDLRDEVERRTHHKRPPL